MKTQEIALLCKDIELDLKKKKKKETDHIRASSSSSAEMYPFERSERLLSGHMQVSLG